MICHLVVSALWIIAIQSDEECVESEGWSPKNWAILSSSEGEIMRVGTHGTLSLSHRGEYIRISITRGIHKDIWHEHPVYHIPIYPHFFDGRNPLGIHRNPHEIHQKWSTSESLDPHEFLGSHESFPVTRTASWNGPSVGPRDICERRSRRGWSSHHRKLGRHGMGRAPLRNLDGFLEVFVRLFGAGEMCRRSRRMVCHWI